MPARAAGSFRVVIDPNVLVAAAISPNGSCAQLLALAVNGEFTLVASPALLDELADVLHRGKFRRWLSVEEAEDFTQAVADICELVADPLAEGLPPICRDPRDDYLVLLCEDAEVTFMVSGDADLLDLRRPGLDVRRPGNAIEAVQYIHPWSEQLTIGSDFEHVMRQAEGEGHAAVLRTAGTFIAATSEQDRERYFEVLVTPESYPDWRRGMTSEVVADLQSRGMTSRAEYPVDGVALVKLPPDPGEVIKVVGPTPLPESTRILVLVHRPDLSSLPEFGGWRVHAYGPLEAFSQEYLDDLPRPST